MASPEYQQIWVPLENSTDCSQGFCTFYCPQWCYVIFPPPPPFRLDGQESASSFSPLVIAIIGILASAFLLVTYYTVVAKYCGNRDSDGRRFQANPNENLDENHQNTSTEPWQAPASGLDESVIKSITVCKYKRGDGLIEGTDCSVCLNEFEEDESLRLLPKCSHAFHLPCIDKWLQAHPNCPLCRASVVCNPTATPLQLPPPEVAIEVLRESLPEPTNSPENDIFIDIPTTEDVGSSTVVAGDLTVIRVIDHDEECFRRVAPKIPMRALSDLGREEDAIIEISNEAIQALRRSISMDSSSRNCMSIADMLLVHQEGGGESAARECQIAVDVECSKSPARERSKCRHRSEASRSKILHTVRAPLIMKRSLSSGKFLFPRYGRGSNSILPL